MALSLAKRSFSLFVYLFILDGAAIFFFTRGFLLTRTELAVFSDCSDITNGSSCFEQRFKCEFEEQKGNDLKEDTPASTSSIGGQVMASSDEGWNNEAARALEERVTELNGQCWTRPAIKKAIILIIDALRFDFVAHSRNFDGEPKPWMDKLPVLQRLVEHDNSSARIFKFVADPPTTTQQRLKGLTTGGLPTFIDIGHSFGAPAIVEDNLLLQLQRTGKRVVMMGDDTWLQLFPTQFTKAYPFPSFNVKDLHTVDDGVIHELFPALHRNDWEVLIGHFLGVVLFLYTREADSRVRRCIAQIFPQVHTPLTFEQDHVGHIFGVESPLMVEKLQQYNDVIENVVTIMKNMSEPGGLLEDTLLIVMGDHGQTLNGDHGGGTPEEVETALFAWSMHHRSSSCLAEVLKSYCDLEDPVIGCISSIPQLDFPTTLASFLGVPFPFGSVGQVNAELFDLVAGDSWFSTADSDEDSVCSLSLLKILERYNEVLCINSWQVKRYFKAYSAVAISGFPPQDLAQLEDLYLIAHNFNIVLPEYFSQLRSTTDLQTRKVVISRMIEMVKEQVEAYREYLSAAASLARSQWTQFSLEWMIVGLSLLSASIAVRAAALYRLSQIGQNGWEISLLPIRAVLINSVGSGYPIVILVVLRPLFAGTPFHSAVSYIQENLSVVILGVTAAASVIAYLTSSPRYFCEKRLKFSSNYEEGITERRKCLTTNPLDLRIVAATLFVVLHALSLFSNSYIVAEGVVINFLMASSGILYLRYSINAGSKIVQAVWFLGLIWVVPRTYTLALFKGLKGFESPSFFNNLLGSTTPNKVLLLQVVLTSATVVLPLVVLTWLMRWKVRKSRLCAGRQWRSVCSGVSISCFLVGLYWIIMDLTSSELLSVPDYVMRFVRLDIPRTIYMITCIVILAATVQSWRISGLETAGRAELFIRSGAAVIAGLSGTIIILMGRRGSLIALLAILEVWCFLELQDLTSSSRSTELTDADKERKELERIVPSFAAIADWSLIATQLFFSTGHSCAFDGLHFSAAFVGFSDFGFYQQGILLAIETFGASHMLPIFGLPLVVLWGKRRARSQGPADDKPVVIEVTKGYLWFGIIRAIVATITTASVCVQRRHLMVWSIFAPKFVFDAFGFLVVDVLVILATSTFLLFQRQKLHNS